MFPSHFLSAVCSAAAESQSFSRSRTLFPVTVLVCDSYQCCCSSICIGECWACQWTCMLPVMLPLSDLQSNSWKHDGGFYIMYVRMYLVCTFLTLHVYKVIKRFSSWTFIFHVHYHCVVVSIRIIFRSVYVGWSHALAIAFINISQVIATISWIAALPQLVHVPYLTFCLP